VDFHKLKRGRFCRTFIWRGCQIQQRFTVAGQKDLSLVKLLNYEDMNYEGQEVKKEAGTLILEKYLALKPDTTEIK
jgi:hypothetical protein